MTFYLYTSKGDVPTIHTINVNTWEEALKKAYSIDPPEWMHESRMLLEVDETLKGPIVKNIAILILTLKMARPYLIINNNGEIIEIKGIPTKEHSTTIEVEFPQFNLRVKMNAQQTGEFKQTKDYLAFKMLTK